MLKTVIVILQVGVIIGLSTVSAGFYFKNNEAKEKLLHFRRLNDELKQELAREEKEKTDILTRQEELAADVDGYEQVVLTQQNTISDLTVSLEEKDIDIGSLTEKVNELVQRTSTGRVQEVEAARDELSEENKKLKAEIDALKVVLKREQGVYYYNLGVAYVQAKLFNNAVQALQKSLAFNEDNPEAHYNLGLLYQNFLIEPEKAVLHYQKYLEMSPEAEDKEEVQAWIDKLGGKIYQKIFTDTSKIALGEKKVEVNLVN